MISGIRNVVGKQYTRSALLRSVGGVPLSSSPSSSSHEVVQSVATRGIVNSFNNSSSSLHTLFNKEQQQQRKRWFSDDSKKEGKEEETPKEEKTGEEADAGGEAPTGQEGTNNNNKEEKLESEIKSLKDQLLRSLAEQENTRQIARKDVESARNFAIKSFAKSLLEVSDNLQRALESVDQEELGKNQSLQSLHEGIQMTNDGLVKAFASNGVVKYCEQPGDVFDPETMNALMEYPDPSKEPGTVGQVIKTGFTLNKRVLRPAEVGVVKKP